MMACQIGLLVRCSVSSGADVDRSSIRRANGTCLQRYSNSNSSSLDDEELCVSFSHDSEEVCISTGCAIDILLFLGIGLMLEPNGRKIFSCKVLFLPLHSFFAVNTGIALSGWSIIT